MFLSFFDSFPFWELTRIVVSDRVLLHILSSYIFLRSWSDEKESSLIHALSLCLEKQRVDLDKLGSIMRSKDHYGNEQLSRQQIVVSLRAAEITLDREMVSSWMKAADIVGKGIYSIPVLLDIFGKADQATKSEGYLEKKKEKATTNKDRQTEPLHEDDSESNWERLLDLNSSLPRQKMKEAWWTAA